jgi:hypothetical protein
VVLCDTGSVDGTVASALAFASEQHDPDPLVVGRFDWCDDFAAARTAAHRLASGEVHLTLDLDDRLVEGSGARRGACRLVESGAGALAARWDGGPYGERWRPRLLRAPVQWIGPTWELPAGAGAWESQIPFLAFPPVPRSELFSVRHERIAPRGRRDLAIALAWAARAPDDWRPLYAAAVEALDCEDHATFGESVARGLALELDGAVRALFLCQAAAEARRSGSAASSLALAREALAGDPDAVMAHLLCAAASLDQCAVMDASRHLADAELAGVPAELAGFHGQVRAAVAMAGMGGGGPG